MTENPRVRIPKQTHKKAQQEAKKRNQDIGDIIEQWRRDAEAFRIIRSDFRKTIQTRGGVDE